MFKLQQELYVKCLILEKKIKVMHNPMLFGVFVSKYSIKENQ